MGLHEDASDWAWFQYSRMSNSPSGTGTGEAFRPFYGLSTSWPIARGAVGPESWPDPTPIRRVREPHGCEEISPIALGAEPNALTPLVRAVGNVLDPTWAHDGVVPEGLGELL